MPGSFESMRWNAYVHRRDLGLYSHPKEFGGMESEPLLTPRGKKNLYRGPGFGSNPRRLITQDSDPNTLPNEDLQTPADKHFTRFKFETASRAEALGKIDLLIMCAHEGGLTALITVSLTIDL